VKTNTTESKPKSAIAPASRSNIKAGNKLKILLVHDHALFRQGLALLLSELYSEAGILEAASLAEALESAKQNADIRLVLLDLTLEDGSGFETLEKLSSSLPDAAIAIVSSSEDNGDIARSYRAGAKGYFVKSCTSDVLRHALPLILGGGVAYTAGLIFYAWDSLPFNHAVWHVFVMAGSTAHFLAVAYYMV